MVNPKRAIALILSLFVLIVLGGFISLATYQYAADRVIHQHYENSIKSLYAIETARNVLLWEESHAPTVNNWDTDTGSSTYDSTVRFTSLGATITNKFYRYTDANSGFNIKARVVVSTGNVYMYIMAYKGTEASPQDAQYLEYVHSPSPMYKYAMFSNTSIVFSGAKLYDLKGGSVHSNGNLEFRPSGYGIRFNNMAQMTASGTIKYGLRYQYPAPHIIDNIDGKTDGMSPAPSLNSDHYQTTTETTVIPGPFRYFSTDSSGVTNLYTQWYGDWVGSNWGSKDYYGNGPYPLIFRGDDTYFYGKQSYYGSFYTSENGYSYLRSDGTYGSYSSSNNTPVSYFYNWNGYIYNYTTTSGYYQTADVYFKPATTTDGKANKTWFELPGSLSQSYDWTDKYVYPSSVEKPVTFYITESCTAGSASCNATSASGTATTGWRYMKEDKNGDACTTDDCYTDVGGAYKSAYVKAQDYQTGKTINNTQECYYNCSTTTACTDCNTCANACWESYYTCIYGCYGYCYTCYDGCSTSECYTGCDKYWVDNNCNSKYTICDQPCWNAYDTCYTNCNTCSTCDSCYTGCANSTRKEDYYDRMINKRNGYSYNYAFDANKEFFDGSDYNYGSDVATSGYSQTTALNTQKQPQGFATYLNTLSQQNITGVISSGVDKKDPYLGNLFDTTSTGDSAYKTKAQTAGVYLSGSKSLTDIVSALNTGLETDAQFATVSDFYNWKTGQATSVVNIDVGKMKSAMEAGKVSFSNGVLYSEVPLMLSNAKDLPGANSNDKTAVFTLVSEESVYLKGDFNTQDWKISNIATEKRVYTLSDAFNANTLPDPTVYTNYPYVKVSVTKENGKVVSYDGISGSQTGAAGTNEVWINADYTTYTASGAYSYYQGMSDAVRAAVRSARDSLQSSYVSGHTNADGTTNFPNVVDKSTYNYNSLFVTPYDIETLENWKYKTGTNSSGQPTYGTSTRNLTGAFLNFYDPYDSRYDDEYRKGLANNEYCTTSTCSGGFNYRDRKAPYGYLYYANITSPDTVQSYDGNFPTASPTSSEGVLGFTGQNSWRPISKEYFDTKTSG